MPPFRSAPELKKLPEPVIIACGERGRAVSSGAGAKKRGGAREAHHDDAIVLLGRHEREADLVVELLVEGILRLRAVEPDDVHAVLAAAERHGAPAR